MIAWGWGIDSLRVKTGYTHTAVFKLATTGKPSLALRWAGRERQQSRMADHVVASGRNQHNTWEAIRWANYGATV